MAAQTLQQIRRDLHQMPELALQEYKTHAYLKRFIVALPQMWLTIKTLPALPTALMVHVQGSQPRRTIGYRADMDGLPITETTQLPFASQHEGIMHACGHDFHMTIALGLLAHFADEQPQDNLLFFFQPAEEAEYGGKRAFDLGAFTGMWRPDEFYALHINPALPVGQIATCQGTLFAGTTEIQVTFTGRGGHAAYPHQTADALVAGAMFVNQVQTIVSRNVDPVHGGVVTLGTFQAGTAGNVIADTACLSGTLRAFSQTDLVMMQERVRAIVDGICLAMAVTADLTLTQGGYMPVENHVVTTNALIETMQQDDQVSFTEIAPAMIGEDFGFLLQQFPGTMVWLGVGDPAHGLHDAQLQPDEAALQAGVTAFKNFLTVQMQQA